MDEKHITRIDAVRERILEAGVDNFLISSAANRYYLSGFELQDPQCNESSGYLFITKDNFYLLTDPRFEEAARRILSEDNFFIYRQSKYDKIINFLMIRNASSSDPVTGQASIASLQPSID